MELEKKAREYATERESETEVTAESVQAPMGGLTPIQPIGMDFSSAVSRHQLKPGFMEDRIENKSFILDRHMFEIHKLEVCEAHKASLQERRRQGQGGEADVRETIWCTTKCKDICFLCV